MRPDFSSKLYEIEENVSNVESTFFKISVAFSNLIDTGNTLRSKAIVHSRESKEHATVLLRTLKLLLISYESRNKTTTLLL